MRGRLIRTFIFLSSRSSESDESYKKRIRQKGRRNVKPEIFTDRPPASILLSFRTRTEVFFDDRLITVTENRAFTFSNSKKCYFQNSEYCIRLKPLKTNLIYYQKYKKSHNAYPNTKILKE